MSYPKIIFRQEELELTCDNCKHKIGFVVIIWDSKKPQCETCDESSNPESSFFCISCALKKRIFASEINSCDFCEKKLGVFVNIIDEDDSVCIECNHDFENDRTEVYFLCSNCRLKIN